MKYYHKIALKERINGVQRKINKGVNLGSKPKDRVDVQKLLSHLLSREQIFDHLGEDR